MMEQVKGDLEKLALRVVTLDQGDIPAMGEMLNGLSSLENSAKSIENETITSIIKGLKNYTERLILDQETEISPLETAVTLLQEMCRAIELGEQYKGDVQTVLKTLGVETAGKDQASSSSTDPNTLEQPLLAYGRGHPNSGRFCGRINGKPGNH